MTNDKHENLENIKRQVLEETRLLSRVPGQDFSALKKNERRLQFEKDALARKTDALGERLELKGAEITALQKLVEMLRTELAEKNARAMRLNEELRTQRELGKIASFRAPGEAGLSRGEAAAFVQEADRLKRELRDSEAACASVKAELYSARIQLIEQDVLTKTSLSALKELKEDQDRMRAMLNAREVERPDMNAEVERARAALAEEKRRSAELQKQLDQELALKADMEDLLRQSAKREEELLRKVRNDSSFARSYFAARAEIAPKFAQ